MGSKRLSAAFAAMFFTAVSGIIVCFIVGSNETPWSFDHDANAQIVGLAEGVALDEWFKTLPRPTDRGLPEYLRMLYSTNLISAALNCTFLFLIVFLASSNTALVLATQVTTCVYVLLLTYALPEGNKDTLHRSFFTSLAAMNVVGLVLHYMYSQSVAIAPQPQRQRAPSVSPAAAVAS